MVRAFPSSKTKKVSCRSTFTNLLNVSWACLDSNHVYGKNHYLSLLDRRRRAGETLAWIGHLSYVPTAEEVSWKLQSSSVASFFRAL